MKTVLLGYINVFHILMLTLCICLMLLATALCRHKFQTVLLVEYINDSMYIATYVGIIIMFKIMLA